MEYSWKYCSYSSFQFIFHRWLFWKILFAHINCGKEEKKLQLLDQVLLEATHEGVF